MPGATKLTIASVGSTSSGLEPTSARPQGCRPCPGPRAPSHPRSWGWGGLASGRCFSPFVGRQRLPLSLSWEFAAGLPLSAALELIPSAEVRHLLPRAFLIPRGCHPHSTGPRGPQGPAWGPPHVGRAASQPQAAAEGASASGPQAGPPWRGGAQRASRGRPARAGRAWGPRRECRRPPRAARRDERVEGTRSAPSPHGHGGRGPPEESDLPPGRAAR